MENKTARDARQAISELTLAVLKNARAEFLAQLDKDLPVLVTLIKTKIDEQEG